MNHDGDSGVWSVRSGISKVEGDDEAAATEKEFPHHQSQSRWQQHHYRELLCSAPSTPPALRRNASPNP